MIRFQRDKWRSLENNEGLFNCKPKKLVHNIQTIKFLHLPSFSHPTCGVASQVFCLFGVSLVYVIKRERFEHTTGNKHSGKTSSETIFSRQQLKRTVASQLKFSEAIMKAEVIENKSLNMLTWLEDLFCDVPKKPTKKIAKANTKNKRNIFTQLFRSELKNKLLAKELKSVVNLFSFRLLLQHENSRWEIFC